MADGETEVEVVRALLEQQHRENFEVDQPLHLRGGGGEHLVEIQRRIDFVADLRENGQTSPQGFRASNWSNLGVPVLCSVWRPTPAARAVSRSITGGLARCLAG